MNRRRGLHGIAHKFAEQVIGLVGMLDLHLQQCPAVGIECRFPQLVGIHLT